MTGITAAGTGSGIDIESLITKLMASEQTPLTKLTTKETKLQSKISLIGQFKSLVSSLQTAATNLQDLSKLSGVKATVGNTSAVSVTATNSASAASYSLDVLQLAKAQQMVSKALGADDKPLFTSADQKLVSDTSISAAKISINFGTVTTVNNTSTFSNADPANLKEISVAATDGNITLQNVADAINGGDYGVKASLISDKTGSVRLSLTGDETGAENAFKIDVSYLGADGAAINPTTTPDLSSKLTFDPSKTGQTLEIPTDGAAVDSIIKLNSVTITRASNTIDDAVVGLTFDLKTTTIPDSSTTKTSTPTTLTVSRDSSTISTQLKSFVDAYNQLASAIKSTTSYNAETKVAGALQGDATIRSLQGQMRSLISGSFGDGSNSAKTLNSLGITFKKDGTLDFDSDKLGDAVTDDLDGVIEFLGAFDQTVSTAAPEASKDGFAYKLQQLTTSMLADNGLIDAKLDGLNKSVKDIDKQQERLTTRLTQIEKRYRVQFTAMDTAIANLQNTSSYLTELLSSTSSSS